jgi:hypothetical protein
VTHDILHVLGTAAVLGGGFLLGTAAVSGVEALLRVLREHQEVDR